MYEYELVIAEAQVVNILEIKILFLISLISILIRHQKGHTSLGDFSSGHLRLSLSS